MGLLVCVHLKVLTLQDGFWGTSVGVTEVSVRQKACMCGLHLVSALLVHGKKRGLIDPVLPVVAWAQVTNGEFLRFVKSGGYSTARYWSAEGWAWKTFRNVKWPTFWVPNGPQGLHK